jgi:hypothetical protein
VGKDQATTFDKRLESECDKIAELVRRHLRQVTITDLVGKGK